MGSDNATARQFWGSAREAILKRNAVGHDDSGIYALVLRVRQPRWVVAGQLGRCRLEAGWYVYVGSAKRNLSARLARHLRREKRVHWHIDYLRGLASVEEIWLWRWTEGAECRTNERIQALSGAIVPWKGFGSSDCACVAHLTMFAARPALRGRAKPQRLVVAGEYSGRPRDRAIDHAPEGTYTDFAQ